MNTSRHAGPAIGAFQVIDLVEAISRKSSIALLGEMMMNDDAEQCGWDQGVMTSVRMDRTKRDLGPDRTNDSGGFLK